MPASASVTTKTAWNAAQAPAPVMETPREPRGRGERAESSPYPPPSIIARPGFALGRRRNAPSDGPSAAPRRTSRTGLSGALDHGPPRARLEARRRIHAAGGRGSGQDADAYAVGQRRHDRVGVAPAGAAVR